MTNNKNNTRKRQQPTHIPHLRSSSNQAWKHATKLRKNIRLQQHLPTRKKLQKTKKTSRPQTGKPTTTKHTLPHVQTLEGYHGILPHQRHFPRNAIPRTQKNRKHTLIHTTRQLHLQRPRRPLHMQNSKDRSRGNTTNRTWLRLRYRRIRRRWKTV